MDVVIILAVGFLAGGIAGAWVVAVLPEWIAEAVTVRHEVAGPATSAGAFSSTHDQGTDQTTTQAQHGACTLMQLH